MRDINRRALISLGILIVVLACCYALMFSKRTLERLPLSEIAHAEQSTSPDTLDYVIPDDVQLCQCQCFAPPSLGAVWGVDCTHGGCGELGWGACQPINWQAYAQGEYVGHARTPHVPEYRIRVDDLVDFIYRQTREEVMKPYELQTGDTIQIQSFTDDKLNQAEVVVQPDGTITLYLLGAVRAARRTIPEMTELLEEVYKKYYKIPAISVTPIRVNTKLTDLLATVDARYGQGGQRLQTRVTPEGTVQLPAIGSVLAHGLTLDELEREINERYDTIVDGVEVTAVLAQRAPRYVYVLGEVGMPGRIPLDAPTTVMMAIAQAGGWNGLNANMRQVVVFRRGDDWRLMATMLDIQGALYGRRPCPADEIWLNDSDIIVVPKTPIRIANEFIEQVFTRGIYGVVPQGGPGIGINFSTSTSL
ncbi:MAG: polysaccharide biosynthesis/export family protein [Pirellulales bacterium]|nr:polysaccharide biosynthesis/export family protein [Pirellulales bacterium]